MLEICMSCGSNEIIETHVYNHGIKWKGYPIVYIDGSITIKKCRKCGNVKGQDTEDNENVKKRVEDNIAENTKRFIEYIIDHKKINQQQLAQILGVTPIHLSRIKTGDRLPSYIIFNFLKTLYFSIKNGDSSFDFASPDYNYLDPEGQNS